MKKPTKSNHEKEEMTNKALLVIDVQSGLFNRSAPIYQADQFLTNIQTLVDHAHQKSVPVFYIQHANQSILVEGSDNWKLHPRLSPTKKDVLIQKRHGSAFQETALQEELESRNVTNLVVAGLVTHGCVKATCLGAIQLSYHVVLVSDGHSNYSKQAPRLIEEWNHKLSEMGVALEPTKAIDFD